MRTQALREGTRAAAALRQAGGLTVARNGIRAFASAPTEQQVYSLATSDNHQHQHQLLLTCIKVLVSPLTR